MHISRIENFNIVITNPYKFGIAYNLGYADSNNVHQDMDVSYKHTEKIKVKT